MATTFTLTRPDIFTEGETVDAFLIEGAQQEVRGGEASAANAAVTTGAIAFTGLAEGRNYVAKGRTSGRTCKFRTTTATANEVPHPSWRQRRRDLGLV